jgi:hypothetical protein
LGLFSKKLDLEKSATFTYKDALLISYAANEEMIETSVKIISAGSLPANVFKDHLNEALFRVAEVSFQNDTGFVESFLSSILTPGDLKKTIKSSQRQLRFDSLLNETQDIIAVILGKAEMLEPIKDSVDYMQSLWHVIAMDAGMEIDDVAFQQKYCQAVIELILSTRKNHAADIDWLRVVKFTTELALVFSILSLSNEK